MTVKGRELLAAAKLDICTWRSDRIMGFIPGTSKTDLCGRKTSGFHSTLPRRRLTGFWWKEERRRTGSE